MYSYQKYGIEVGQYYKRGDGASETVRVVDVHSLKEQSDVVVIDTVTDEVFNVDCFKLTCRYYLVD